MSRLILIVIFSASVFSELYAQREEVTNLVSEGNEKHLEGQFIESEKEYRKAISLDNKNVNGLYNLGNTYYESEDYEIALQRYFEAQKAAKTKEEKHKAFHNLGNAAMKIKDYQKAVDSYKNALINNPADKETQYNYAVAKSLLEKEKKEQEKKDKNEDKDKEGDEKKDKKDKGKEDENKDKKGDEKKDGDKEKKDSDKKDKEKDKSDGKGDDKKEKAPPPPRKKGQISLEQVKSLLEAMNNQEKGVQEKVKAKKIKGVPVKTDKDW